MATLNYAFKEISCKIVYYGCGLCGKTTNLQHVHKTVPGKFRGELVSLATEQDRTLFFDFLPLDLGEVKGFKTKFQLYTVPGQVYYNATRKLVLRGVDGLVFVVDSQRDRLQENIESFENLKQNLAEYNYHLQIEKDDDEGIPWVLQLNKRDMPQISTREEIVEALDCPYTPVMDAVAVTGIGVKETLKGISSLVIQKLNTRSGLIGGGKTDASKPGAPVPTAPGADADDDDYGSIDENELEEMESSGGHTPAPPAPPAPAAPKATAAPAAAPQAAHPPSSSAGAPPNLNVTQFCDARWRGMKTGSGMLSFSNIQGTSDYQLTGQLAFIGAFKRTLSLKMAYRGVELKGHNGQDARFHKFETIGGESPILTLMVSDVASLKELFGTYNGFGGEIAVSPQGKPALN